MPSQGLASAQCPTSAASVRTVKGVQVDGKAVGLPEALATVSADIRLVAGVGPHVAGQLDGLGKHSITVLAGVHLPWKHMGVYQSQQWARRALTKARSRSKAHGREIQPGM